MTGGGWVGLFFEGGKRIRHKCFERQDGGYGGVVTQNDAGSLKSLLLFVHRQTAGANIHKQQESSNC
jgi:hypothetical protein